LGGGRINQLGGLVSIRECSAATFTTPHIAQPTAPSLLLLLLLLLLLQITHLFKDVLHGNGRFVMVVNVSPAAEEFNETKRVLQVLT
jgi:hypothetical protein